MEVVEVGCDKVVFVYRRGVFGFGDEELCNSGESFGEGFDGYKFVVVVVESFAFGDKVFDLDGDGSGKAGHCGGEIFICLDLKDSLNRLQGHGHLTVVGDPFGVSRHPEELLRVRVIVSKGAEAIQRVLVQDGTLFRAEERQDEIVDLANGGFHGCDILFRKWISKWDSGE